MRRRVPLACLFAAALLFPARAQAIWTDVGAGLTGVGRAAAAWGDYDADGDLDLAMAGQSMSGNLTRLYRNDGGTSFAPTSALPAAVAVTNAALAWGDYDRDGDLDLAIAGHDGTSAITRVLRNDGGTFVDAGAVIAGVQNGDVAWGDLDNDGDLDLAVAGTGTTPIAKIYRNTTTGFEAAITLDGMASSALAWGDYDRDGDEDLVLTGLNGTAPTTVLYRNASGTAMNPVASSLVGVSEGSVDWGDFDNDGDLDLLLTGRPNTGFSGVTRVYRNTNGVLTDLSAGLQGVFSSAGVWGDFDNDGDLDIAVAGRSASASDTDLYRNTGSSFVALTTGIINLAFVTLAWGDIDDDSDLDLAIAGLDNLTPIARIYRNSDALDPNTRPTTPSGLTFTRDGTLATFAWNASGDAQGGSGGLHYNLRVGSAPGASDLVSPMARGDGWRRVARGGNAGQRLEWSMPSSALGGGNVYWSVQAIDQSFAGSAFASEHTVAVADDEPAAATALRLDGANPFHGEARILCALARAEPVAVTVHDPSGRRVRSLVRGMLPAGTSRLVWRGDDDRGRTTPPGIYLVHLRGKGVSASLRIAKLR